MLLVSVRPKLCELASIQSSAVHSSVNPAREPVRLYRQTTIDAC